MVAVLHLIHTQGLRVATGHGQRAAVTVHGDPAGQVGSDGGGGVAGQLVEESGDVVGVEEQLLQFAGGDGTVEAVVLHWVGPISEWRLRVGRSSQTARH